VASIAIRDSRTKMRSRPATHNTASGSSNGASDLPIRLDPGPIAPIGLNTVARGDRKNIRAARNRNRVRNTANDDLRVARAVRNSMRADRNSMHAARNSILAGRKSFRAARRRNGARIAANDELRIPRSAIGAARVGSKRRRSRATRDPTRPRRPVQKSLVRIRARVKGLSRRLLRVHPSQEFRRLGLRNAGTPKTQETADGSCVITHVVLLRPRADLSADERAGIVDAFRTAVRTIPSIRRVRLGKRVKHGRQYEQSMHVDYEYAALLDFDNVGGLQAYLEHPAHEALATRFFQVLDDALMYDFELEEGENGLEKLA
jgi:hypothetical protein